MITLCKIFEVPFKYFDQSKAPTSIREVDFYLVNGKVHNRCEVKLMGKGNPESADAVHIRNSALFVADKLSDLNKQQLDTAQIQWVELRSADGYKKFADVLDRFGIPHQKKIKNLDVKIDQALNEIFVNDTAVGRFEDIDLG